MDPKIWGYDLWKSLIHIAQVYPDHPKPEKKRHYQVFFYSLAYVLPCYVCQKNYLQHLKELPIQLESKTSLLNWVYQIHNRTLIQSNKKAISYESFLNKYGVGSSGAKISFNWFILLILVVIVGGYYYFFYNKRTPSFSLMR